MDAFAARTPSVLIVDDRHENLVAMGELLADIDCEILCATGGFEAIEIAKAHDLALVILDVQMPQMNGVECARRMREIESVRHVPIVLATAHTAEELPRIGNDDSGVVDLLFKPIDGELFLSKVRTFVDIYRYQHELRRSNSALKDFAHAASHDLRAPVRHIAAYASFIEEDYGHLLPEDGIEMLRKIEESTTRMRDLIERMLAHAAVGAAKPVMSAVAMDDVLKQVMADLQLQAQEAGAQVKIARLPAVWGEATLLYQLFQNLVSNALKFRREGVAHEVSVECEVVDGANTCLISVRDNGIGFEPSEVNRIFEPFQRLVSREEFDGSGVGMATSQKIAELHGGSITASGEPGNGSVFVVALPASEGGTIRQGWRAA